MSLEWNGPDAQWVSLKELSRERKEKEAIQWSQLKALTARVAKLEQDRKHKEQVGLVVFLALVSTFLLAGSVYNNQVVSQITMLVTAIFTTGAAVYWKAK